MSHEVEAQDEELATLTMLYEPENFHFDRHPETTIVSGWYRAHPKLPHDSVSLHVRINAYSQTKKLSPFLQPQFLRYNNVLCKIFSIEHIPPIMVSFTLPPTYPVDALPLLALDCYYIAPDRLLSIVEQLNAYLSNRVSGEPCLWECFEFLESNLVPMLLGVEKDESGTYVYDMEEAISSRHLREQALEQMVEYDSVRRRKQFDEDKVGCVICGDDEKMGRECTRLTICGHIACKDCLRNALSAHIANGVTAGVLRCLHCNAIMELFEVKEFATPSQFAAYDRLLLQRSLAFMSDVVQCPRPGCSRTCLSEDDNLARCPYCQHVFCPRCLRLYHPSRPCVSSPIEPEVEDTVDLKPEEGKAEGEAEEEGEKAAFVRYEDEEVLLPSGNMRFLLLIEDVAWMTWKLSHTIDPGERRELISRIFSARTSLVAEAMVSRKFKEMNLHRCPNCGLFVQVSCFLPLSNL
ncbi:unnamed protein product [Hydatigera taeniaeformis]|uniref:RBR-type E3 ubiquitin transferase n=1 Tax=Hydatigena taeniaeformis TaxID=6205 RepID=A0A0R3X3W3_HYDTA|nr:unnamed protein product [Hydatigera taeniaeformis]